MPDTPLSANVYEFFRLHTIYTYIHATVYIEKRTNRFFSLYISINSPNTFCYISPKPINKSPTNQINVFLAIRYGNILNDAPYEEALPRIDGDSTSYRARRWIYLEINWTTWMIPPPPPKSIPSNTAKVHFPNECLRGSRKLYYFVIAIPLFLLPIIL